MLDILYHAVCAVLFIVINTCIALAGVHMEDV